MVHSIKKSQVNGVLKQRSLSIKNLQSLQLKKSQHKPEQLLLSFSKKNPLGHVQTALPGKFRQPSEQFKVLLSHSLISTGIK